MACTPAMAAMTASSRMTSRIDASAAPDSVAAQSTFAPRRSRAQAGAMLASSGVMSSGPHVFRQPDDCALHGHAGRIGSGFAQQIGDLFVRVAQLHPRNQTPDPPGVRWRAPARTARSPRRRSHPRAATGRHLGLWIEVALRRPALRPQLVPDAVEDRLPQIPVQRAFAAVFESVNLLKRLERVSCTRSWVSAMSRAQRGSRPLAQRCSRGR